MRKRILLCLTSILLISAIMVPSSASAASEEDKERWNKYLTTDEKNFILKLSSSMQEAHMTIKSYRDWLNKWATPKAISRLEKVSGRVITPAPSFMFFENCMLGSVPETMSDIADMWNTEVCNEFGYLGQKMSTFNEGVSVFDFSVDTAMMRLTLGRIESAISKIDEMAAERVEDLCTMREAEKEARKELDLGDDECFIATASYGTPAAKEIDELRRFRDEYLRESSLGNKFIAFYYENSPPIADFISEHEILRTVVREGFVEPVVKMVAITENCWSN